ncbi:LETM1-like protein-domain-containing protein [Thelephora terrestris]|uniref:LETM1-like protein-domain-containing protein n=1 Tax=Thelephora terrestris TaxID=56493 RepID=A0A9P6HSV1_9AGAM|nr:LETM1-like protein-domain-containing protein [Thelephora terrestris]
MIRSFNAHGIARRSVARRNLLVSPLNLSRLRYEPLPFHSYRLLTTPTTDTTPKATSPDTPNLQSVSPRKHKVELRPGPVKTLPSNHTTTSTAAAPGTPDVGKNEKSVSDPVPEPGIVETVKIDYSEASKHGILAPPPADASKIGRLWHQAKEYFKFYFRGLKLIFAHRRQVKEMLARVKAGGQLLSRWETRFIETHRADVRKLVPFALVLVTLEELIPLMVIYAPFMLPSTCILPSQRERILSKRRQKTALYAASMKEDFRKIVERASLQAPSSLTSLSRTELLAMNGVLNLSTFGPPPIRRLRLTRHLRRITQDDTLLEQEGLGQRLTLPELQEALDERGFVTSELSREDMLNNLERWLSRAKVGATDPVLKRIQTIAELHAGQ